jgi:hypothetical protein
MLPPLLLRITAAHFCNYNKWTAITQGASNAPVKCADIEHEGKG